MTRRTLVALAAGVAAGSLALSACGSNSLSSGGSSSSSGASPSGAPSTAAKIQKDDALAAKLPAKVKKAGVIVVGTDATYAPNEFLKSDGKTVQGMDVDLFDEVAKVFGVKVKWDPANFDSIILGVSSGKYDIGISSFSITPERKKQVNMVSYFSAGTQWVTLKGNPQGINPDKACGKSIAVQKGTTQLDDITARSKKCTSSGKPAIHLIVEQGQDKVTSDVVSGKAAAMLADSPVGLYAIKQTNGQLEKLGETYDSAPYGYVVPKNDTNFAHALADALTKVKDAGAYKPVLAKWNIDSGAITNFTVNP